MNDPNAALIGKPVCIGGVLWTICGSTAWSTEYLTLRRPGEKIVRAVGLIRRHIELTKGERCGEADR